MTRFRYLKLSEQIRHARRTWKYTQKEVSEKVGVSTAQISKIENGYSSPKISTIQKLAKLYKTTFYVR